MGERKIKQLTDLNAWREGHSLVLLIYKVVKKFPKEETFSLKDQMQRAAVSVTSNIAEGFGRQGLKEKIQFYYLAQGSLTELKNQIIISRDVGYLSKDEYSSLDTQAELAHKLLQGLIRKTKELYRS